MDDSVGFIIGISGVLLKTTDAGNSWFIHNSDIGMSIPRIDFVNELVGFAVGFNGSNGMIGKTTDGGTTWNIQFVNSARQLISVQFINSDVGIIVGNFGIILKTTDAGSTWVNKLQGSKSNLTDIWCSVDSNEAFVVGAKGTVLHTSNGGVDWMIQTSNTTIDLNSVFFVNRDSGIVVGKNGLILITTNQGITWNSVSSGVNNILQSVFFIDDNMGFIVGQNGRVLKTANGGNNWIIKSSGTTANLKSVFFTDSNNGFAIGTGGTIVSTTNAGENWMNVTSGVTTSLNDIRFSDLTNGIAVGNNGVILNTSDSGINWFAQTSGTTDSLFSIFFIPGYNGSVAYIAGGFSAGGADFEGIILNTVDGGNTWTSYDCESSRILYSISFPNSLTGFAVGEGGTIIKTINAIVPVELISFTSSVNNDDVTLNWQTVTETNNQGFGIERSKTQDERNEDWENISFVNGSGTTTEPQSYSFADENLSAGKYQYRLKQIDFDGTFEYSNTIEVEINQPTKFTLDQNFPNPFNPSTNIQYAISSRQFVTLKVFDVLGKEVATLVNEEKSAGSYGVDFNASHLASGIYYYQLRAGDFIETKKMVLLR